MRSRIAVKGAFDRHPYVIVFFLGLVALVGALVPQALSAGLGQITGFALLAPVPHLIGWAVGWARASRVGAMFLGWCCNGAIIVGVSCLAGVNTVPTEMLLKLAIVGGAVQGIGFLAGWGIGRKMPASNPHPRTS